MVGSAERLRPTAEPSQAETAVPGPHEYLIDTLLRSGRVLEASTWAVRSEIGRVLFHALREGQMSQADQAYLAQLTVTQTGITIPEAEKRVADFVVQTRQAEDSARKATAHLLLWLFLSLLMGAFSSSFAATIGGRQAVTYRRFRGEIHAFDFALPIGCANPSYDLDSPIHAPSLAAKIVIPRALAS